MFFFPFRMKNCFVLLHDVSKKRKREQSPVKNVRKRKNKGAVAAVSTISKIQAKSKKVRKLTNSSESLSRTVVAESVALQPIEPKPIEPKQIAPEVKRRRQQPTRAAKASASTDMVDKIPKKPRKIAKPKRTVASIVSEPAKEERKLKTKSENVYKTNASECSKSLSPTVVAESVTLPPIEPKPIEPKPIAPELKRKRQQPTRTAKAAASTDLVDEIPKKNKENCYPKKNSSVNC